MEIKCSREDLLNTTQTVQKAVSARSTLPILTGIKIKAEQNKITLSATDLEIAIREELVVDVISEGEAVVPARLLGEIVKNLSGEEARISLDRSSSQLNISCGQAQFSINSFPVEDFPSFPKLEGKSSFVIEKKDMVEAVRQVVRATSKDETRPILAGVFFLTQNKKATMVATDSYRLAVKEFSLKRASEKNISVIVPGRALEELVKIIPNQLREIEVVLSENQIAFKIPPAMIVSRLIEGQFPDYKQLLPETYKTTFEARKEDLVDAVRRAAILAQNTPLRLTIGGNKVKVAANTSEVGQASEDVGGALDGEPTEVAFNAQYLLDGMTSMSDEKMRLELIDPLKPGIIRPEKEKGFLYLIMPVRVN